MSNTVVITAFEMSQFHVIQHQVIVFRDFQETDNLMLRNKLINTL